MNLLQKIQRLISPSPSKGRGRLPNSKAHGGGVILFSLLFLFPSFPEAQPSPSKPDSISPAAKRAAIRDSLRRERMRQRETVQLNPPAVIPGAQPLMPPAMPSAQPIAQPVQPVSSPIPVSSAAAHAAEAEPPSPPMVFPFPDTVLVKSLNMRNAEIRDVLQGLAVQYKVNIVMAPDVQGPVTVNLNNISLKNALKLIAEENGYQLSAVNGAIRVGKRPPPKPAAPPAPKFSLEFTDGKLSADLQKIPMDQVARKLVEVSGRNVVLESGASGDATAFFKAVDWSKALKLIGDGAGLESREKDGVWSFYRQPWNTGSSGATGAVSNARMRINFKDKLLGIEATLAPLGEVVNAIGAQTGIGTVVYGELKGSVTLRVNDIKIEDAFRILFRGTEYTFWIQNGIYFIGPPTLQGVDNSKLIVLKHLRVDDVSELLPTTLTKDAQIKVVKSQNALMVLGSYEVITGIGQYVDQIDRPIAQILIEALVVDVDMDRIRQYGVDMFLADFKKVPSSEYIYPNVDQVLNKERSQNILSGIPGLRDIVSLPKNFVAKVEALEQDKVLKIRSRPQIATLNGSEATITVGQTQYFLLKQETDFNQGNGVTSRTSERFEKIEANVTLTVTPFVTGEGEITCDIVPDFSEPEGSFDSKTPPTLNRRQLRSKVRLRDGETIVLGGLVKESTNRTTRQVPFLGSIPILGWLFKNNVSVTSRSQLLIFVTPHVFYGKDAHVDPEQYLKKATDLKQ